MKAKGLAGLLLISAMLIASPLHAEIWSGEIRGLLPPDSRPCAFFSIAGVPQVDPVRPNSPWVAVRKDHPSFREIFAFLLAARHTGTPVTVSTSGTAVAQCDGHVELTYVYHTP
jgi:hypothetical protein